MMLYYDVKLKNDIGNSSISYLADSFSVDENRILRIKSIEFGDITVKIHENEKIVVNEIILKDECDDMELN